MQASRQGAMRPSPAPAERYGFEHAAVWNVEPPAHERAFPYAFTDSPTSGRKVFDQARKCNNAREDLKKALGEVDFDKILEVNEDAALAEETVPIPVDDTDNKRSESASTISAIAGVIPAEALLIYTAAVSLLTNTPSVEEDVTTVTFKYTQGLEWLFLVFIILPAVFYLIPGKFQAVTRKDLAKIVIVCLAMACWLTLQKPSMFDFVSWASEVPDVFRIVGPLIVGAILVLIGKALGVPIARE